MCLDSAPDGAQIPQCTRKSFLIEPNIFDWMNTSIYLWTIESISYYLSYRIMGLLKLSSAKYQLYCLLEKIIGVNDVIFYRPFESQVGCSTYMSDLFWFPYSHWKVRNERENIFRFCACEKNDLPSKDVRNVIDTLLGKLLKCTH